MFSLGSFDELFAIQPWETYDDRHDHRPRLSGPPLSRPGPQPQHPCRDPPLDTLIAIPFDTAGEFDAIFARLKTGTPGAVMRAGLYDCDSNGLPDSLIEDAGEQEVDQTSNHMVQFPLSAPTSLSSPYWVVALFGGDTVTMEGSAAIPAIEMQRIFGISTSNLDSGIYSVGSANAVIAEYSYAALPATFPTPTLSGSTLGLWLRTPE